MEYARMPNIATSLPHFRESFPSPSFKIPKDYTRSQSPSCSNNTFVAPLSASSLQAYNNLNASMMMNKRKARDFDNILLQDENEIHESKRLMLERGNGMPVAGPRQRQESGCSVSSSSSWSSSASFSTVYSSATVPDLSVSPPTRSLSRSPSPSSDSNTDGDEYNPLWHICDAIALAEKQDAPFRSAVKKTFTTGTKTGSLAAYSSTRGKRDDGMYGLKIVFLEPNWLAEHIAKSKKVAALKKQQRRQ